MKVTGNVDHRWAVVLAGGNGVRLRPLSRQLTGDDRPKQFCRLWGGRTLLSQTRRRLKPAIPDERTLLVLTREHQPFYEPELAAEPAAWTIVQPSNRGTAAAILWSLLRIGELDWDAVVAFFPADHYYARESRFRKGVAQAFIAAERNRQSVVVLGAEPDRPESGYGWIEVERQPGPSPAPVRRFWEKPDRIIAEQLLRRGCLWSTFIMVGSVGAFLEMTAAALPALFATLYAEAGSPRIASCYDWIEPADFSRHVLSRSIDRLLATSLGDAGWSDLGDPGRARAVMARKRVRPESAIPRASSAAALA